MDTYETYSRERNEERLKYFRLSMSGGFEAQGEQSRESWLAHLQALDNRLETHLNALRQAVVNAAISIQQELPEPRTESSSEEESDDSSDDSGNGSVKVV